MECQSRKDVIGTLRTIASIIKRMRYPHSFLIYKCTWAAKKLKNKKFLHFSA